MSNNSSVSWRRVNRSSPCKLCGKPDWCIVSADGAAAICARVESPKRCGESGWLHRLGGVEDRRTVRSVLIRASDETKLTTAALESLTRRYVEAATDSAVADFAGSLGVSVASLRALHVGWDGLAWAFPMQDAEGRIIGIRRRLRNGEKLSVKGGREGLFVPIGLASIDPLLLVEGPTDTAAMLDPGFSCIGRPSCIGGIRHAVKIATGREVVVVADNDGPGQRGAAALASALRAYCPAVRIISPPIGVKDSRAWKQSGAARADVLAAIENARPLALAVRTVAR